jgi:hypothetical protein
MTTATSAAARAVTLYTAGYRADCPSNASGQNIGYGLTPAQARANREPWANQAAWTAKACRSVLLVDGSRDFRAEKTAWEVCGLDPSPEVDSHLQAGRWASAVTLALGGTL